jgi:hypothetical protein
MKENEGMKEGIRRSDDLIAQSGNDVDSLAAPPTNRCELVGDLIAHLGES